MNKSQLEQLSHLGFWKLSKMLIGGWFYFYFRFTNKGYHFITSILVIFLCVIISNNNTIKNKHIPSSATKIDKSYATEIKRESGCRVNLRDVRGKIISKANDLSGTTFLVSYRCSKSKKISLEVIDSKFIPVEKILNYSEPSMGEIIINHDFKKPNGSFHLRVKFSEKNIQSDDLDDYDLEFKYKDES